MAEIRQLRNSKQRPKGLEQRPHGFRRADDEGGPDQGSFLERRRADGTPFLLFTVLAVVTGVGLARVESRVEILDIANEITELSEDHQRLLDRKRRLETERAFLRRPERVRAQAVERLGMEPAPPQAIQRIEVTPARTSQARPSP